MALDPPDGLLIGSLSSTQASYNSYVKMKWIFLALFFFIHAGIAVTRQKFGYLFK